MTSFVFAERTDAGTIYLMVGLLLAIFLPSSLFFGYQMFKRRHNITVRKRYPSITFATAIAFSLRLITSSITLLLLSTETLETSYAAYTILLALDNAFLYLFFTLSIWRMWSI